MKIFSLRANYWIGALFIAILLGVAAFVQFHEGVAPCPLCELQRFLLLVLGAIFIIGGLFKLKKGGHLFWGLLGLVVTGLGLVFSGRQVYLQHAPPEHLGDCGISLRYLFKIFSFPDALKQLWKGGTECSHYNWAFLNLSLAEWSLMAFVVCFILTMMQLRHAASE